MSASPIIPEIIRKICAAKNLLTEEAVLGHLYPRLDNLRRPEKMKNLTIAADRVVSAMRENREIVIWGDYDVDGTTGTALLVTFLRSCGMEPRWYIPDRLQEGYGVSALTFSRIFSDLCGKRFLFITVDCGISDREELAAIASYGGEIVVTDHHQLPLGELPEAIIVNPEQEGCGFIEEKLAGVGLAFYLAAAVRGKLQASGQSMAERVRLKEYLGFVALGTIADMVPLTETNRIMVRAGMEALRQPELPGLQALMAGIELLGENVTSEDISFGIGPRLNAAGRLGKAEVAMQVLAADNVTAGLQAYKKVENLNAIRKEICARDLELTLRLLNASGDLTDKSALVASGPFHSGVVGIVAARLVELYRRPVVVLADSGEEEYLRGSGRSVAGMSLVECLQDCDDLLAKYGGHAMAAGLTIARSKVAEFTRRLDVAVQTRSVSGEQRHELAQLKHRSLECSLDEVMQPTVLEWFQRLEPFGVESERPLFAMKDVKVVQSRPIGADGSHLQLQLRDRYNNHRAVAFGLAARFREVREHGKRLDIYFTPMLNRYQGKTSWQARVLDFD